MAGDMDTFTADLREHSDLASKALRAVERYHEVAYDSANDKPYLDAYREVLNAVFALRDAADEHCKPSRFTPERVA
jgi:hypothetical protein